MIRRAALTLLLATPALAQNGGDPSQVQLAQGELPAAAPLASAPAPAAAPAAAAPAARYRLSGTKALQPLRISDDGERTYIEWGEDQLLPAVFALNPLGDEEMADGYMRGGIYTIDRVHPRLLFRIDQKWARAERVLPGKGRK